MSARGSRSWLRQGFSLHAARTAPSPWPRSSARFDVATAAWLTALFAPTSFPGCVPTRPTITRRRSPTWSGSIVAGTASHGRARTITWVGDVVCARARCISTVPGMKQVLQHRIDSTFAHYDVNRNGVIELADIYALANRLLQAFGEPASSE